MPCVSHRAELCALDQGKLVGPLGEVTWSRPRGQAKTEGGVGWAHHLLPSRSSSCLGIGLDVRASST